MPKKYLALDAAIIGLAASSLMPHQIDEAAEALKLVPAADVVEVRYCRFSLEEARRRESVYKCSNCGNFLTVRADTLNGGRGDMNYCPFCGGKVKHGGQDE